MTTAVSPNSEPRVAREQIDLALTLEFTPGSATVLLRALVLLHRRRCRVTEAGYRSGTGGCDRLDLRIQAPAAHAHCVPAWLAALVEVRRVVTDRLQDCPGSTMHLSP